MVILRRGATAASGTRWMISGIRSVALFARSRWSSVWDDRQTGVRRSCRHSSGGSRWSRHTPGVPAMTEDEAIAFLSEETHTGKLATAGPAADPHVAPIWFIVDGHDLVFSTGRDSVKGQPARQSQSRAHRRRRAVPVPVRRGARRCLHRRGPTGSDHLGYPDRGALRPGGGGGEVRSGQQPVRKLIVPATHRPTSGPATSRPSSVLTTGRVGTAQSRQLVPSPRAAFAASWTASPIFLVMGPDRASRVLPGFGQPRAGRRRTVPPRVPASRAPRRRGPPLCLPQPSQQVLDLVLGRAFGGLGAPVEAGPPAYRDVDQVRGVLRLPVIRHLNVPQYSACGRRPFLMRFPDTHRTSVSYARFRPHAVCSASASSGVKRWTPRKTVTWSVSTPRSTRSSSTSR